LFERPSTLRIDISSTKPADISHPIPEMVRSPSMRPSTATSFLSFGRSKDDLHTPALSYSPQLSCPETDSFCYISMDDPLMLKVLYVLLKLYSRPDFTCIDGRPASPEPNAPPPSLRIWRGLDLVVVESRLQKAPAARKAADETATVAETGTTLFNPIASTTSAAVQDKDKEAGGVLFCEVALDDIVIGRTKATKAVKSPFWRDAFSWL
jgi:hypothetical protein